MADSAKVRMANTEAASGIRWVQSGQTYGNPKWHWMPERRVEERWGREAFITNCEQAITVQFAKGLPEGMRPGLARNNVCSRCKKAYLATRPDLQGYFDRLNDKRDI